jgi:hypothetical protein
MLFYCCQSCPAKIREPDYPKSSVNGNGIPAARLPALCLDYAAAMASIQGRLNRMLVNQLCGEPLVQEAVRPA